MPDVEKKFAVGEIVYYAWFNPKLSSYDLDIRRLTEDVYGGYRYEELQEDGTWKAGTNPMDPHMAARTKKEAIGLVADACSSMAAYFCKSAAGYAEQAIKFRKEAEQTPESTIEADLRSKVFKHDPSSDYGHSLGNEA